MGKIGRDMPEMQKAYGNENYNGATGKRLQAAGLRSGGTMQAMWMVDELWAD